MIACWNGIEELFTILKSETSNFSFLIKTEQKKQESIIYRIILHENKKT